MPKKPTKPKQAKPGYVTAEQAATGSYAFTHADITYVRRKRRLPEEAESHELNIVPYLDILVNLIMFLLVTQATLVSLGVIDVTAPSYAPPGPGDVRKAPENDKGKNLRLTLGVAQQGFFIAAKGGVLPGENPDQGMELTREGVARRQPTIPLKDGKYDYPGLTRKLRSIKTVFPEASAVYLAADSGIPYHVVVKTLDASRADPKGPLFPNVAFSRIN